MISTIIAVLSLLVSCPIFTGAIEVLPCNGDVDNAVDYELKPLKLGVEISGIDLKERAHDTLLFEKIKQEAYRHRLMIFRNQGEVPADTLLTISKHFGSIFEEPFTTQKNYRSSHLKSPSPAIMRISNDVEQGVKGLGTTGWHIDGAYKEMPFSFLIFNAVKAPRIGDTKFIGFREVLTSLNEETFERWDTLSTAINRTVLGEKVYEIHPLIHNHPVTNETVICVHTGYMEGAVEHYGATNQRSLTESETEALRAEISQEFNKDAERLVYSHKWHDGDLVIVDNFQIAHLASKESQMSADEVGLRVLHRVAINGVQKPRKLLHKMKSQSICEIDN